MNCNMEMDYSSLTFEPIDASSDKDIPWIIITGYSMRLNKCSVKRLHCTEYAQFCVNVENRVLAIRECDRDEELAMKFLKKDAEPRALLFSSRIIRKVIVNFVPEYDSRKKYMIRGSYDEDRKIMYYDFKKIEKVVLNGISRTSSAMNDRIVKSDYIADENTFEKSTIIEYLESNEPKETRTWYPTVLRIYVNDVLHEEFMHDTILSVCQNDKVLILASKQVSWNGHASKRVSNVSCDFNSLSFEVQNRDFFITYSTRQSYNSEGERETGKITFVVVKEG